MTTSTNRTLKVLVVDDEIGMCLGTQKVLRRFEVIVPNANTTVNFDVDYATSGESFDKLTNNGEEVTRYDLYLLDYKLPDCSGTDLLQKVLKVPNPPLVIMITAYATFETAVMATKMGAYDFIPKPFNPEELKSSVKKATTRFILEEQSRHFAEERKKIRFQFISVLAHELKAPLNAVEGYLQILNDRYGKISESDYHHMLSRSLERTNAMRKLIFDLLDMTRIESGEKKRNLVECDLKAEVYRALDLVGMEAQKRKITMNFTHQEQERFIIKADISEIEIVLNNLFSNGIKYNRDEGRLDISLQFDAQKNIVLKVEDTGIGIKEEDLERLFQDFVRVKNEHTLKISGSGLGLSTVKKVCALYSGTVSLTSTYGVGSLFTIILPKEVINS